MSETPVFGACDPGRTYVRRPSVYALLRDPHGKWAVVRTPQGCFLPGGGAEPGETHEQTVQREALEECGFVLKIRRHLGSAIQFVYSNAEKQYFEKICEFVDAELVSTTSPTEIDHELLWLDLPEALRILHHESHCWALSTLAPQPS